MTAWTTNGLARLDGLVGRHVAPDGVPGAAWLVAREGEVHVGVAGTLDGSSPVRRDSIFRIASMTKPITAAAVLALAEDGVLRLDDPLALWLPELADRRVMVDPRGSSDDTVPAVRQPTVHDALTFRLGWGMDFADWEGQTLPNEMARALGLEVGPPQPSKAPALDEFAAVLGRFPLEHQPGEKWLYNMGSDVLGAVVERATGQRFGDVLAERIFGPLGMRDTAFHVPAGSMDRFGPSYLPADWAPGPGAVFDLADGGWAARPAFESGAGGLVSTLDDYLAFAQALLDGGGPILSRSSVAAMTADQLYATDGSLQGGPDASGATGWGFGVGVVRRKTHIAETPGTYSWTGGMGTSWANDPTGGLVGILLTNQLFSGPWLPPIHQDFWTSVYTAVA
ncbi:MAG: serine hydrolase domain-containing protein [Acidimicrobiales bacterium]